MKIKKKTLSLLAGMLGSSAILLSGVKNPFPRSDHNLNQVRPKVALKISLFGALIAGLIMFLRWYGSLSTNKKILVACAGLVLAGVCIFGFGPIKYVLGICFSYCFKCLSEFVNDIRSLFGF